MPTEKISGIDPHKVCKDPDHLPPSFMVWEPGRYRHTCSSCGHVTEFTVHPVQYGWRADFGELPAQFVKL